MSPHDHQNDDEQDTVGIEVPVEKHRSSLATEPSNATLLEEGSADTGTPCNVRKVPLNSRWSRREWALSGVAVVALVGLAVGLAIALQPSKHDEPALQTQQSPFLETKAYIDNVCSSQNDASLCEEVCEPALCCTTTSKRNSCLSQNAADCLAYSKCHVVFDEIAPPAPLDLENICSQADLSACHSACQAAECCYSDEVESCQATHLLKCLDYAPCQVLREDTTLRPSNTNELFEYCSLSVDGTTPSKECEVACRKASCCWNDDDSCLQSDFLSCLTYSPCQELKLRPPHLVVDKPRRNIEQVCSVDSLLDSRDGYERCQEDCERASCCSSEKVPPYNCFQNDPFGCLFYEKCERLSLAGGSVPRAPSNINEICKDVRSLDASQLQTCIATCKPSACCGAENDNCYNDGNVLACDEYQVCKPIYGLFEASSLSAPPDNLRLCTPENVATASGYQFCEKICEPAECCNSMGEDNCLLDNIVACGEWNIGGCYLLSGARGETIP